MEYALLFSMLINLIFGYVAFGFIRECVKTDLRILELIEKLNKNNANIHIKFSVKGE